MYNFIVHMVSSVSSSISMQSPSPAPVQKPPIPQEHMSMVQAFDAMLERCKGRASTTVSMATGHYYTLSVVLRGRSTCM